MLSKRNRLTRLEFMEVFNKGTLLGSDFFVVKTLRNNKNSDIKFGIGLSKKSLKTAVSRNLIRRRIYSILQKYKENKVICSLIILPKKKVQLLDITRDKLESDIDAIFKKINHEVARS